MGDLGRAALRRLQLRDVGVCPNDLGAVAAVELLDAFAGVTGELAERVHGVRQDARYRSPSLRHKLGARFHKLYDAKRIVPQTVRSV